MNGRALVVRADARSIPLADESVDIIVTSPPYWAKREYEDGGRPYAGQLGIEANPLDYLDDLLAVTAECLRVLTPRGSMFVNLDDKFSDRAGPARGVADAATGRVLRPRRGRSTNVAPRKSLLLLPQRYAVRVVDELGVLVRQEVVWDKPGALPESVHDRNQRSHETWWHIVKRGDYYSALDRVRVPLDPSTVRPSKHGTTAFRGRDSSIVRTATGRYDGPNPLGALPRSVWRVHNPPFKAPPEFNIEHTATFPFAWPRFYLGGYCPAEVCLTCGLGRRPVVAKQRTIDGEPVGGLGAWRRGRGTPTAGIGNWRFGVLGKVLGEACGCTPRHTELAEDPEIHPATRQPTGRTVTRRVTVYEFDEWEPPPARRGRVLDPFSGTGTTATVAAALGLDAIALDLSFDYCRLGRWRTTDPAELAAAADTPFRRPQPVPNGQAPLFEA